MIMRIVGYGLMGVAFVLYFKTVQTIWLLVAESRKLKSGVRFNRFWCLPAWKLQKEAYPISPVRKRIVILFTGTFVFMLAGTGCMAVDIVRKFPEPHVHATRN